MAKQKKEEQNETIDILEIKNDLVKYIDSEVDKRIDSTFNQKIRKEFLEEIDNSNRRLIREKNKRNICKNIIIIILILIIFYLVYLLYKDNYFDKYFIKEGNKVVEKDKNKTNEEKIDKKETLEELKTKYSELLDNIVIYEESNYLEDYYNGNLTEDLKKYLALNLMNLDELEVEEDYNIIEDKTLEIAYKKIFEDNYSSSNFDYNGTKIRYLNKIDSYITDNILKRLENNIVREIVEINLNNNKVEITTIEGLLKENKLYNVLTKNEINEYNNDNIITYQDKLNKVTYVFENNKLKELRK